MTLKDNDTEADAEDLSCKVNPTLTSVLKLKLPPMGAEFYAEKCEEISGKMYPALTSVFDSGFPSKDDVVEAQLHGKIGLKGSCTLTSPFEVKLPSNYGEVGVQVDPTLTSLFDVEWLSYDEDVDAEKVKDTCGKMNPTVVNGFGAKEVEQVSNKVSPIPFSFLDRKLPSKFQDFRTQRLAMVSDKVNPKLTSFSESLSRKEIVRRRRFTQDYKISA